jgi:predicted DNA-binding transcriptional regulator AlpA
VYQAQGEIMAGRSKAHEEQFKQISSWIGEALILLLDEKPYRAISVEDIAKKAGVARPTFYRHFTGKDDVILQFFDGVFNPQKNAIGTTSSECGIVEMTFPFGQVLKYANVLKKILNSDAEQLCYVAARKWSTFIIDQYTGKMPKDKQIIFNYLVRYKNYGAMLLIINWIKDDMPVPPETIIKLVREMTNYSLFDAAVPQIVLNIQI